jgi:hypothetical protein
MPVTVLRKNQIYYTYLGSGCELHLTSGKILVRNLSAEIEGLPEMAKLAEGEVYVLPRSGWMMLSAQSDSEIRNTEPAPVSRCRVNMSGWLQRTAKQAVRWLIIIHRRI